MLAPSSIAKLFFSREHSVKVAWETFALAEWRGESHFLTLCSAAVLRQTLSSVASRDRIAISITFQGDPVVVSSAEPERVEAFLAECHTNLQVHEATAPITLSIVISKAVMAGRVSLYSPESFKETLRHRQLSEVFGIFSQVTNADETVSIELPDVSKPFKSHTLVFRSKNFPDPKPFPRSELIQKRNDFCHFETSELPFTPEDFHLIDRSENIAINEIFDRLCVASAVVFLADVSQFRSLAGKEMLNFKLNGYRAIAGGLSLDDLDPRMSSECFRIYEWVYSEGGVSDKMGLARNIISLHWKGKETNLIEDGVLASIRSGYAIYLKQNVKQYIEVKNKVSEFLAEFSQKTAKLAESLTEKLEKNVAAFVAFFITSVIAKVLTDKTFTGVLTRPLALIGITIIGFSLIHLLASLLMFNKDKGKVEREFGALKSRYADIFDPVDLDRIFLRTGAWEQTSDHLTFKRNVLVGVWLAAMLIFLALVCLLTDWHRVEGSTLNTQSTNTSASVPMKPIPDLTTPNAFGTSSVSFVKSNTASLPTASPAPVMNATKP